MVQFHQSVPDHYYEWLHEQAGEGDSVQDVIRELISQEMEGDR